LIEVKTTNSGMYTPFHVTRKELSVSKERAKEYHLYRVFDWARQPRVFTRAGVLDRICDLVPITMKGGLWPSWSGGRLRC
jgi:hypothetical protein